MKVLVFGGGGQVGRAFRKAAPAEAQLLAPGHTECDITDAPAVVAIAAAYSPDIIVNLAAYTAVDNAESEPTEANRINGEAVGNLSAAASASHARLIHVSTDYVFDGRSREPYAADATAEPVNAYGRSKLLGEIAAARAPNVPVAIVRTAWVYSAHGRNFLTTMLRLMKERDQVTVVMDQFGTPTAAKSVAEVLWRIVERPQAVGTFHWTDGGVATWHEFATAISEQAIRLGIIHRPVRVLPVPTSAFPTAARRPAYSVLATAATGSALGLSPIPWRQRLQEVLVEVQSG